MKYTTLFLALITLCLFACSSDSYHYTQKQSIDSKGWSYEQSTVFNFEITDTPKFYTILLDVNHTTDFPYQNLYYKVETDFPSGKHLEQVISSDLADKAGIWHGNCSGKQCIAHIDLQKKAKFNELGTYQLQITQHSRDSLLQGVNQLTLKLKQL